MVTRFTQEKRKPRRPPIELPEVPEEVELETEEDAAVALQGLYETGDIVGAEQLLESLGVAPEEITAISSQFVERATIEEVVTAVFPAFAPEELLDLIETDFDSFVADMQGFTEQKAALLGQLGYSKGEIDSFYGMELPQVTGGIPIFDEWVTGKGFSSQQLADDLRARGVAEELIPGMVELNISELRAIYEYEHNFGIWGTAMGELDKIFISEPERIPEVAVVFARSLARLPKQLVAAILLKVKGQGAAGVVDKDWGQRLAEEASEDMEKFIQDISEQYPNSQLMLELSTLSQNLAFSITAMGAGLIAGIPIALMPVPGSRYIAYVSGTTVSGEVAYNMATYEIMQQYLELKDAEKFNEFGIGLTQFEEDLLKKDFHDLAVKYGLWEAIPEALSNLAFYLILAGPLGKMIGGPMATRIIAKVAGIYGEELLTETVTQMGQHNLEVKAGLREGELRKWTSPADWVKSLREIAPQTFLLTTVMAGAGQVIISSTQGIKKIKESLTKEIGIAHPRYEEFVEKIETDIEDLVKTEPLVPITPPVEIPAVVPGVPIEPVAPDVPVVPEAVDTSGLEKAIEMHRDWVELPKKEIPGFPLLRREDFSGLIGEKMSILRAIEENKGLDKALDLVNEYLDEHQFLLSRGVEEQGGWSQERWVEYYSNLKGQLELRIAEVKPPAVGVAKPPVKKPVEVEPVIPPDEPVSQGVISNTQGMRDVGAKEVVRPARKVLIRIGQWRELFKPVQKAEVELHEEQRDKTKMFDKWQKLLGKDKERWALVSDEINEKGSVIGLTFDEKRVVNQYRAWADEWADRKNLPEGKRIKDYMPHLFEQEAVREVKEEGGIDPVLAQILSERETKKIIDPFLKKRLGAVGWIKDPVAAARAYEAVSLKFAYYTPMLNKIDAILADPEVPQSTKKWLSGYSKRMTGELSDIDRAGNITIREFATKIRGVPGIGEYFYTRMTQGNPMGMVSYNLTGVLYMLFLGFKATSAIRNLSQHTLILGEVGPQHFANGLRLRFTTEGRAVLAKSLVLRSRKFAYTAGLDASFASRWTDKFREATLFAFRLADKQNVSDAFLAGYSEAKALYPDAGEQVWLDRGDEVAADTQYLYTKMNSMSFAQSAPGRTMSMLTTWTENWIELMTKWVNRTPSQVYLEQERLTGKAIPKKNWSQTYKAIALYMTIVGLAFAYDDDTRLKLKEYTGVGSLRYLAGAIGGEFPALQAVGSVADIIAGFLLNDERQMKSGLSEFRRTFTPGIVRQLSNVGSGEKDWMTLMFYLEGKDFHIKNLKDKWSKGWEEYVDLTDAKMRSKWREDNWKEEAQMFVAGRFSILSTDKARAEVLRLIEEHKLDTDLIDGYDKIFGVDTKTDLSGFQKQLGTFKIEEGKEVEYFTTSNYLTEVNKLITVSGLAKVQKEASPFTSFAIAAQNDFDIYFDLEGDGRVLHRQLFPDVEASLYLFGKIASFSNPNSAVILLALMEKYNLKPESIPAFVDDPSKYDALQAPLFQLQLEWNEKLIEYDALETQEERELLLEENPEFRDARRQIEAINRGIPEKLVKAYVDYYAIPSEGHGGERFLRDNPDFYNNVWLSEDFLGNQEIDFNLIQTEEYDKALEKYELLETTEERQTFLTQNTDFRTERRRLEAFRKEIPENFHGEYIDYYEIPGAGYENERYLMEHDEFYRYMVDSGIWKERDFSNVPTERFEETLIEYEGLDVGSARYNFRGENPWFDEEGVRLGRWKPFGEPRAKPKPRGEPGEVDETDFGVRQSELEEALEGLK